MSAYLMGRVFYTELPAHLKLTLLALADHAGDDGSNVTVGQTRLARKVGSSERSVRMHLAELRELGWIEKVGRVGSHGQDRHRIVVERLPGAEQIALLVPPQPAAHRRPATSAGRGSEPNPRPATQRRLDRQPASAEPSVNRQKTSPSAKSPTTTRPKPTPDSIYLAERINERWRTDKGRLSPAAIQRFVAAHGAGVVEDALRELHGFPPEEAIRSPYAYLEAILVDRGDRVTDRDRADRQGAA